MTTDFRALCAELLDEVVARPLILDRELIARARAVLAESDGPAVPDGREPASVATQPSDEQLLASVRHFYGDQTAADMGAEDDLRTARAVLAQFARPAAAPVPVSERLPGPEDCDAEGRCWLGGRQMSSGTPTWLFGYPGWAERFLDVHHFWLPANALPRCQRGRCSHD